MKSKRIFLLCLLGGLGLFMLNQANAYAADNVDFSGKWVLNEEKSNIGESRFFSTPLLSVEQSEGSIKIDRTRTGRDGEERTTTEDLKTDGTENLTENQRGTTKTVATWAADGKSLTFAATSEFERQGETMTMERTEVWTIDDTGKVLTIKSTSNSPNGEVTVTLVYDKQ